MPAFTRSSRWPLSFFKHPAAMEGNPLELRMKLQKWALVAEIISGVAVAVTLVVLVIGVKENTAALRATAAATSRDSLSSFSDLMLVLGTDRLELLARSVDAAAQLKDFTDTEQMWIEAFQRSFFRRVEAQYFQFRNGLMDEDAWQTVRHRVLVNTYPPVHREIWEKDKVDLYTKGFVAAIETDQIPEGETK